MKLIELFEDCAKIEVNGKVFDVAIFQHSNELVIDLDFIREFEGFDELNACDECEQGYQDIGEGDESHFVRCECQPKIK